MKEIRWKLGFHEVREIFAENEHYYSWPANMEYFNLNHSLYLFPTHCFLPLWLIFDGLVLVCFFFTSSSSCPRMHIYGLPKCGHYQLIRQKEHCQPSKHQAIFCSYKLPQTTWGPLTQASWTTNTPWITTGKTVVSAIASSITSDPDSANISN